MSYFSNIGGFTSYLALPNTLWIKAFDKYLVNFGFILKFF